MAQLIMIVDDEPGVRALLNDTLRIAGFETVEATDGMSALTLLRTHKPDLLVIDINMPLMDGFELVERLRSTNDLTPVLMLTAREDKADITRGLKIGADDYVVKPYHPGEVVARVQAVLRRSNQTETKEEILRWQSLEVDVTAIVASIVDGDKTPLTLDLTPTEFSLLTTLMRSPSHPFSRQHLLEHCLPESEALERVVDTHIYNLRKKLEAAGISGLLVNVRGVGYRFRQP